MASPLTVAVPDHNDLKRLSPPPAGVSLIVWDITDAPISSRIDLLVLRNMVRPVALQALAGMDIGVVQSQQLGYDAVKENLPPGLVFCNAVTVHEASTAELALALTLASLRELPELAAAQSRSEWVESQTPGLAKQKVLLIGVGGVGREIEKRLDPFDVTLIRMARTARQDERGEVHGIDELDQILPLADVVILAVPLSDETEGLVSVDFLAKLKPGALLVNVARGKVVDTNALIEAVTEKGIRAALDVTDPDPLPPNHPLWRLPGVIITPHVGGHTHTREARMDQIIRDQIALLSQGLPPKNIVVRS